MTDVYKNKETPWRDEGALKQLYHDKEMSTLAIGERLGCDGTTVLRWMERHGIERRNREELSLADRFWEKVDRGGRGECWEWGGVTSNGYGQIWVDGRHRNAHRVAYSLERDAPGELQINHHCDNPTCVNPSHLYRGTQRENMEDKFERGRANTQKGDDLPQAKLTSSEVREIKERLKGGESQYEIAEDYPVGQTTISKISIGEVWSHV